MANITASHKVTIAEGKLTVNNNNLSELVIIGKIKMEPNQPAERLVNHPENTNKAFLSSNQVLISRLYQRNLAKKLLKTMRSSIIKIMSQKGLVPILIVLIIAAAVGGYLIYSGKINLNQMKPTPTYRPPDATTMSKNQNGETANWKTYTNTQFGFSFQYPSTTKITITRPFSTNPSTVNLGELNIELDQTTPYDILKVQPAWAGIGVWRNLEVTIKDSVSRDSWCDKLQPSLIGQEECKSKANLPESTFNGYKAFLFHELISSHVERNTYYIPYNHYVFVIVMSKKTILSPNGQGWIIVEDPNLSKILATFKFIPQ